VIDGERPGRLALVVHPTRDVDTALATLREWATDHGVELIQLSTDGGGRRELAPRATLVGGELVVALGGDGTVLSALRAAAATDAPVLGVACGSLGALSAVVADELGRALERVRAGDWTARSLPALAIRTSDSSDDWAVNDFVVVRRGPGQMTAELAVNGELYVRLAGDGFIVATPAGSSGYSMAAGGPLLTAPTPAFVCTPLAMHGGSAPPLVVPADASVTIDVQESYAGFDVEIDGHHRPLEARSFRLTLKENKVNLVTFSPSGQGLGRLRERGIIGDSPRILARDRRAVVPHTPISDASK
jgi:NAD+ kinase